MHAAKIRQLGFTLVELVIVMVLVSVMSAYVYLQNSSPGVYTLLSQSQTLAADLRHAQALATTMGKPLQVLVTPGVNGSYSVGCVTPGASPCNSVADNPMTNPVTGALFTVSVKNRVSLSVASGTTPLQINTLGQPVNGAIIYRLSADTVSKDVNVAAVTGFVSIP